MVSGTSGPRRNRYCRCGTLLARDNTGRLRAAHTADDREFGAHILATMTNQAIREGQPAVGVTLIETALAGTRGQATPALLAELHMRQALAHATSRDASACTQATSQARKQVEALNPDDDPPWLYWMDPAAVTASAGNCFLQLGQPGRAAALLRNGLDQFSTAFVRDRQNFTTLLADALARPGKQCDLDTAAGLGMQSLDMAESLDSNRGTDRLRDLCFRLKPHDKVPAVRDFLDRATSLAGV